MVNDVEEPMSQECILNLGHQQRAVLDIFELGQVNDWKVCPVHWL